MNPMKTKIYVRSKNDKMSLLKSLHMQNHEVDWIKSLESLERERNISCFDSLCILKTLVPSTVTVKGLRNCIQLFLRMVSSLMEELKISQNEMLLKQTFDIVKDLWALFSHQHVALTQQTFGTYSPTVTDVLPSLASIYVDLFIAVYSTRSKIKQASKRLYNLLMFELNERCAKTALLEVSECTEAGAKLLLPLLRQLLSRMPAPDSHLDYLLHFILLKRWTFVCMELFDLYQASLNIKASGNFLKWLCQCWPKSVEYLPTDNSLNGRRISEFLLELDQQAVEELIDVFSQHLGFAELSYDKGSEQMTAAQKQTEQDKIHELFIIDKKGTNMKEMLSADDTQSLKKKRKLEHHDQDGCSLSTISNNNIASKQRQSETDNVQSSGHSDRSTYHLSSSSKKHKRQCGDHKHSNAMVVTDTSKEIDYQNMNYADKVSGIDFQNKDEFTKAHIIKKVETGKMYDVDSVCNRQLGVNPDLSSQALTIYSSDEEDVMVSSNSSFVTSSSAGSHINKNSENKLKASPVVLSCQLDLATESAIEKRNNTSRRIIEISSKESVDAEGIETVSSESSGELSNMEHLDTTEFKVGLMLSKIRKSMPQKRELRSKDKIENSFCVATRLRTKSYNMASAGNFKKTDSSRVMQTLITTTPEKAEVNDFKYGLRGSPGRLRKNISAKNVLKRDKIMQDVDISFSLPQTQISKQILTAKKSAITKDSKTRTYERKPLSPKVTASTPKKSSRLAHELLPTPIKPSVLSPELLPTQKTMQEPHQNRYFLRTNCSHRLLNSEAVCPTCSPEKI